MQVAETPKRAITVGVEVGHDNMCRESENLEHMKWDNLRRSRQGRLKATKRKLKERQNRDKQCELWQPTHRKAWREIRNDSRDFWDNGNAWEPRSKRWEQAGEDG